MAEVVRSLIRDTRRHAEVAKRLYHSLADREPEYPSLVAVTRELARTSWQLLWPH